MGCRPDLTPVRALTAPQTHRNSKQPMILGWADGVTSPLNQQCPFTVSLLCYGGGASGRMASHTRTDIALPRKRLLRKALGSMQSRSGSWGAPPLWRCMTVTTDRVSESSNKSSRSAASGTRPTPRQSAMRTLIGASEIARDDSSFSINYVGEGVKKWQSAKYIARQ